MKKKKQKRASSKILLECHCPMYYSENQLAPRKELKGNGNTISSGFTLTEERLTDV